MVSFLDFSISMESFFQRISAMMIKHDDSSFEHQTESIEHERQQRRLSAPDIRRRVLFNDRSPIRSNSKVTSSDPLPTDQLMTYFNIPFFRRHPSQSIGKSKGKKVHIDVAARRCTA